MVTIEISWYKGDIKGFLEASKPSPDAQTDSLPAHKLHETLVWLNGDKAVAVIVTTMTGFLLIAEKVASLTHQWL